MNSRSIRFLRIAPALLALSAHTLIACGDDDGHAHDTDTGTPPADTGTPTPPPPPRDMGPPIDMAMPSVDTGPTPGDTGPRPDMGPPGPTITMSGVIRDFLSRAPVEGLSACVYELPDLPCATTAADGAFTLSGIPANAEVRITYRNDDDGWQPTMVHLTMPATDFAASFVAIEQVLAEGLAMDAGIEIDPGRALVVFNAFDGATPSAPLAGVSATLDPDDAEQRAYLSAAFAVDTTLEATTSTGFGFFANVPPGPHTLRYAHPDRDCVVSGAWAGATPDEARMDVVAGYFVSPGAASCPAPM